jgi:hypothetical protein
LKVARQGDDLLIAKLFAHCLDGKSAELPGCAGNCNFHGILRCVWIDEAKICIY